MQSGSSFSAPSPNYLLTVSFSNDTSGIEIEPNDDTAQALTLNTELTGSISTADDVDYYAVEVTGRTILTVDFKAVDIDYTGWKISLIKESGELLRTIDCVGRTCEAGITASLSLFEAQTLLISVESASAFSAPDSAYVLMVESGELPLPPESSKNLQASWKIFQDRIEVTWTKSERATHYSLYRGEFEDSVQDLIYFGTLSEHVDFIPEEGREFFYAVVAENIGGVSESSTTVKGSTGNGPSVVDDLSVTETKSTSVKFSFTEPNLSSDGEYQIVDYQVRFIAGCLDQFNWNAATSSLVSDVSSESGTVTLEATDLPSNKQLTFALRAIDSRGFASGNSNLADTKTLSLLTLQPSNIELSLEPSSASSLNLTISNTSNTDLDYQMTVTRKLIEESQDDCVITEQSDLVSTKKLVALDDTVDSLIVTIRPDKNLSQGKFSKRLVEPSVRRQVMSELQDAGAKVKSEYLQTGMQVWDISALDYADRNELFRQLQRDSRVESVSENHEVYALSLPNDSRFDELWGLVNTGQQGGVADADIDADIAWDITLGSRDIVVAVIDTGVDYRHEDLMPNNWMNASEIPNNGIDDDNNGFIDDLYGYDFVNDDADPMDDQGHGTHVAGTIGAFSDNGYGIAGVAPRVSLMGVKFLSASGRGDLADAISSIYYAVDNGAHILNNSWGGGGFNSDLKTAIRYARDRGVLFVAAAGNSSNDNDVNPAYPASYDLDNVISVAASDRYDNLTSFSHYGRTSVDLAAPGASILSTTPDQSFDSFNGTSMAAPHVAGAAALVMGNNPSLLYADVKRLLLETVDQKEAFRDTTLSRGRLNVGNALLADRPTWITLELPDEGQIEANEKLDVTALINTEGLAVGTYFASILLSGDGQIEPSISVVELLVGQQLQSTGGGQVTVLRPTDVRVVSKRSDPFIELVWSPIEEADFYRIYRSGLGGESVLVGEANISQYRDSQVQDEEEYTYSITAVYGETESDKSGPISASWTSKKADLSLLISASSSQHNESINIEVRNLGPDQVSPQVTLLLPEIVREYEIELSSGECERVSFQLVCNLNDLGVSDAATLQLNFVSVSSGSGYLYAEVGSPSGGPIDAEQNNNSASLLVARASSSDLEVSAETIEMSDRLRLTLTGNIKNNGPDDAQDFSFGVRAPRNLDVEVQSDRAICSPVDGDFVCGYDRLSTGERSTFVAGISAADLKALSGATITLSAEYASDSSQANNTVTIYSDDYVDLDQDGVVNNLDDDDDGDGVPDDEDALSLEPDESVDTDGDGIGNNADTDDDNDGVSDVDDAFPLNAEESLDTDEDGIGNNADTDDDNDGMPDSFESDNGLEPLDSEDAASDADSDGVSNLDEYLADTDPTVDDYPPILTVPEDIVVVSQGPLTSVDLGEASAFDSKDGNIVPDVDNAGPFPPGRNEVTWSASDEAGNTSTASQKVDVIPLITISGDEVVVEGGGGAFAVALNGEPVAYPVEVSLELAGTAESPSDHSMTDQRIVLAEGLKTTVSFSTVDDGPGEGPEVFTVSLNSPLGAELGSTDEATVTIVESNVAPKLSLTILQNGISVPLIYADQGEATIRVSIDDANPQDSHSIDWSATDNRLSRSIGDDKATDFVFDPTELLEGVYEVAVTVSDDGMQPLEAFATMALSVEALAPDLSDDTDTDGDGVSDASEGLGDSDGDRIPDYLDNSDDISALPTGDGSRAIQSSEGTQLSLGDVAVFSGSVSADITLDDIESFADSVGGADASDDEYYFTRGIFDFEVAGLSLGSVADIVVPLSAPLLEGSVYRKYDVNRGWSQFVEDSANRLSSAPGELGVCPAPGSSSYLDGLIVGSYCVQLSIEDGGDNDHDTMVNGVVKDPGGIAIDYVPLPNIEATNIQISDTNFAEGDGEKVVLAFALDADAGNGQLEFITIQASGTLDEVNSVDRVRLYLDADNDGVPDATERLSDQAYTQDDGALTFTLSSPIQLLEGQSRFLISYQL